MPTASTSIETPYRSGDAGSYTLTSVSTIHTFAGVEAVAAGGYAGTTPTPVSILRVFSVEPAVPGGGGSGSRKITGQLWPRPYQSDVA
jgi:hypothetical protein